MRAAEEILVAPRLGTLDGRGRGLREIRNGELHARGAVVLAAELAADVAAVDRLAEDRRLPERERLEPVQGLDVAAAALDVALSQLRLRREAGLGCHGRRPERVRLAGGLGVGREEIADVGSRVAD